MGPALCAKGEEEIKEGREQFQLCLGGRTDVGREVAGVASIGEETVDRRMLFPPLASHLLYLGDPWESYWSPLQFEVDVSKCQVH